MEESDLKELIYTIKKIPETSCSRDVFIKEKRRRAKKNKQSKVPTNIQVLKTYMSMLDEGTIEKTPHIERLLKKRGIRSESGIVAVQVLTKPFRCPGECIFCPNDATMPKSYVNTQPGAMRALLNQFDPYKQVYNRLLSLTLTGHDTDKIEMIVLGGTWDVYPKAYKEEFIKGLYDACNSFPQFLESIDIDFTNPRSARYTVTEGLNIEYPKKVQESLFLNETAKHRIIGLTIETRPEYVTDENCQFRRTLGVTRLEMGIQTLHNDIHTANKRGHNNQAIRDAMHKLRQYAFKVSNHYMPGLYTATPEKDLETFKIAFSSPFVKSDELKFYPTAVIPNTPLFDLFKSGEYTPIGDEELKKIIYRFKLDIVPPYSRIKRLARDFDTNEVVAGANTPNIRQLVMNVMQEEFNNDEENRLRQYKRLQSTGVCKEHTDIETYSLGTIRESLVILSTPLSKETTGYTSLSGEIRDVDDRVQTISIGGAHDTASIRNFVCLCTRCREVRHSDKKQKNVMSNVSPFVVVRRYRTSVGEELFLSFEDDLGYLYGFLRLLLVDEGSHIDWTGIGPGTALVRELHIYGTLKSLDYEKNIDLLGEELSAQHKGYGTKLMRFAEEISRKREFKKLSVISGIGVRGYYSKLGYNKCGTYMVKSL